MAAMTKQDAVELANDVRAAVAEILASRGYAQPTMKVVYGDSFKITFETTTVDLGDNGVNLASREAANYKDLADYPTAIFGKLDPDAIGKVYKWQGRDVVFLGYNPRAKKYPFVIRELDSGAMFKASEQFSRLLEL